MTTPAAQGLSIASVPLFAGCSEQDLRALAAEMETVDFQRDAIIFREGEPGNDMYVVAGGQVRIVSDVDTEKVVFAHFGLGDFFGEMALLSGEPRSAGAVATTDATLWRLSRPRFLELLKEHPAVNEEVTRVLSQRVTRGNTFRFHNEAVSLLTLTTERQEFSIGRWPDNDLQLSDPQVDGVHAKISRRDGRWFITDQGSTTGTYVNRKRIQTAELQDGDEVLIGTNRVYLDGLNVKSFLTARGRLDATGLVRTAGGRRILDDVSLTIMPGEFVVLVGGSGAGKTSLLHALNGFSPADEGRVLVDGVDLYQNLDLFRPVIGYLPQDDIIHPQLTTDSTLHYAAHLRLPSDMSQAELSGRIEHVLATVRLGEHRKTTVSRLSGGQRKRLSLAVELLATPRLFFLDEPTSGLDPALESLMMALFRDLTAEGVSLIISTHSTQSLRLCDRIAWMSQGKLVFFGSPAECLRHFQVSTFGEIYELLNEEGATGRWEEGFRESRVYQANIAERQAALPGEGPGGGARLQGGRARGFAAAITTPLRQWYWLTRRYAEIMIRDPAYLGLLLVQAPVIALALLSLFRRDIFATSLDEGGDAFLATAALKAVLLSAIWLGAFNAARAISSETSIYARERLVNLGILPYIASKVAVLSVLCLAQSLALAGIVLLRVEMKDLGSEVYPLLLLVTFLTALGGLTMGLLVSSTAHNSDQAMAGIPILVIPQLIFDGSFVPLEKMLGPAKAIAQAILSKWSLELAASVTELPARFGAQLPPQFAQPFQEAFTIDRLGHWLVLGGFILVPLLLTVIAQKRKDSLHMR